MKLYRPPDPNPLFPFTTGHWLPFMCDGASWIVTDRVGEADVIPVMLGQSIAEQERWMQGRRPDSWLLLLRCFHMGEKQDSIDDLPYNMHGYANITDRLLTVHTNMRSIVPKHVYHDIIWNRQKAFLTDWKDAYAGNVWCLPASREMYALYDMTKMPETRVFLSPTRVYPYLQDEPRMIARRRLLETIRHYDGWYSDFGSGKYLDPQQLTDETYEETRSGAGGKWWPVAERYYRSSYVSIYVETTTAHNDTNIITEKTYDPLIQGHYILPFGPKHFLKDVRDRGFRLPDWLDYSYDDIDDFEQRLDAWIATVHSTCQIPIAVWAERHARDLDIFLHNRNLLHELPYHSLYEGVINAISYRTQNHI